MSPLAPLPAPETIPPGVSIIAKPHVFAEAKPLDAVPYGLTIAQIVELAAPGASDHRSGFRAWIDDREVPVEIWARVRPKAGRLVYVHATAHGGGRGGKNVLALVLQVAVLAAGIFLPPLLFAEGATILGMSAQVVAGATINILGNLAIGLLLPVVPPALPQSGDTSQTYSLTGGSNTLNQYGPVPSLFGLHRIVPPYAAAPYTELVGKDQYLRVAFLESYGEIQVSDQRIGDTPLDSYRDVELETRAGRPDDAPRTLYTNDVEETQLSIKLAGSGALDADWHEQETGIDADEISFDITWPAGLIGITKNGEKFPRDVTVYAQYRPVEGATWYDVPGFPYNLEAQLSRVIRGGLRFTPANVSASGKYRMRLAKPRVDVDAENGLGSNVVYWTALRTIHHRDPIQMEGVATESLRIRANDQLNGNVDQFNVLAQLITWDYDAEEEEWVERATRNPASAYLRVLRGPGRRTPLADARIDWASIEDWHVYCDEMGWTFDAYLDSDNTVAGVLRLIATAGRAAPAMINGKHGVVIDRQQSVPVQMFTPRNSWGFKGSKAFPDLPHALRIRFINAASDYQQDEVTVYADGYDATNATLFATDEVFGCTDADQIYRHGRFRLAQGTLRAETWELWADAEVLRCTRGDLVRVSHDVILVGLAWGRIIGIADDAGSPPNVVSLTLDQQVVFAAGKAYALVVRTVEHGVVTLGLVNPAVTDPVSTATVTLDAVLLRSWLSDPASAEGGDLVTFGEAGIETEECIVTRITPGEDLSAKLMLMAAAPGVYAADTGPVPAFESKISRPARLVWTSPAVPVVYSVRSDEAVLLRNTDGTLVTRILIQLVPRAPGDEPLSGFQARIKLTSDPTDEWTVLDPFRGDSVELSILDVDDGETYDIELRAISTRDRPSGWTRIDAHFVIGKTTPPPAVETAWRNADGTIAWTYPNPPLDFGGFLIRSLAGEAPDSNWSIATPAHANIVTAPPFSVANIGFGVRTVLVRAVDVSGNVSTTSARLVIDFGPAVPDQLVDQTDLHPTWPGFIETGEIDTDLLVGEALTLFWDAVPSRPFWSGDPGADFWGTGNFGAILYLFTYTPSEAARLLVDIDIDAAQGWTLEWAVAPSHYFWVGDDGATWWSGDDDAVWWAGEDTMFRPWPGQAEVEAVEYLFRLVAVGGAMRPEVTTLSMLLDVPTLRLEFDDLAVPDTGLAVDLDGQLRWVNNIQMTLEDDGGEGFVARWTDKNGTPGPTLTVYDAAGAAVAGTVDAIISGARA